MRGPIYIAGPTASGKSALALELASRLNGEIISVDSMQVYRGMDIGTAKPSREERLRVPHHLIDVADVSETFDVARFLRLAQTVETEIRARGRVPIFCGGTGLYFKALVSGIGHAPAADETLRAELEQTPLPELLRELSEKDPETFAGIDRANRRRVVRAIEVFRSTGLKFSTQRSDWSAEQQRGEWYGLELDRAELNARINRRVDEMFSRGLVDETNSLLGRGLEQNPTAMQSIGYRQVVEYLRGEHTLAQTIDLVKTRTRQFAKRQMTWFRHQLKMEWLTPAGVASLLDQHR